MNRLTLPGLATLVVTLLAAVWLIISPFVMQTQPAGKGWTPSTVNDVVLGGLLFAVSCVAILAILVRYRVTATFFNIGAAMATRPWLVREEVEEGYAMGNHTWNHPDMVALPAASPLSPAPSRAQSRAREVPTPPPLA